MALRDEMARILAARRGGGAGLPDPSPEPITTIPPFEPSLPHFVTNGDGTWSLTPYAWAHCVSCGAELAEGQVMNCPPCRRKIDETVMPWEVR